MARLTRRPVPPPFRYDVLRIDGQTNTTFNKAALLRLSSAGELEFERMVDFPSTSSKFVIRYDPVTRLYFTLSTDVTPMARTLGTIYARNHLVVAVSPNLTSWDACRVLLEDDTGFPPEDSARYTGFHYVDWVFDGRDILYAARVGGWGSLVFPARVHRKSNQPSRRPISARSTPGRVPRLQHVPQRQPSPRQASCEH